MEIISKTDKMNILAKQAPYLPAENTTLGNRIIELNMINRELREALQAVISGNVDHGTYWQVDIDDINQVKAAIKSAEGGDPNG